MSAGKQHREAYFKPRLENDSDLKVTHFVVKNPERLVVDIEGIDLVVRGVEAAKSWRNQLAAEMSSGQIAEAQRLAREWLKLFK